MGTAVVRDYTVKGEQGVYASREYKPNETIGVALVRVASTGDSEVDFVKHDLALYIRSSKKPNVILMKDTKKRRRPRVGETTPPRACTTEYVFRAIREILPGDEITVETEFSDFESMV